jgi:hypothetical protein
VVGRKKEIERVIQILGRRTKNNPCLIGEPGARRRCCWRCGAVLRVVGVVAALADETALRRVGASRVC